MACQKTLLSTLESKFLTKNLPAYLWKTFLCSAGIEIQSYTELENQANLCRRPRFAFDHARCTGCLVLWWWPQLFFSFASRSTFSLHCFSRSSSLWFNFTHFFCRNHYSVVFNCDCKTSREFNGLVLLWALRGVKLVFHWLAAWLSWLQLWWGVISFQNFRSLKLGLNFCMDFLASSELIGYVDLTDSYEIWPKYSLVIIARRSVRHFWYSKYFSFYTLSCDEDWQTLI